MAPARSAVHRPSAAAPTRAPSYAPLLLRASQWARRLDLKRRRYLAPMMDFFNHKPLRAPARPGQARLAAHAPARPGRRSALRCAALRCAWRAEAACQRRGTVADRNSGVFSRVYSHSWADVREGAGSARRALPQVRLAGWLAGCCELCAACVALRVNGRITTLVLGPYGPE